MNQMIFVNLPVRDLARSVAFFGKLGYSFNPEFTNENAAAMVVSDAISVMLLNEDFFKTFIQKEVADATRVTETIVALSAESRAAVDAMIEKAVAAGAKEYRAAEEHAGMYGRSFEDLDGHLWEYVWMDGRKATEGAISVQEPESKTAAAVWPDVYAQ